LFTPKCSVVYVRQGVEFTKVSAYTDDLYDFALVTYPPPLMNLFHTCVKRIDGDKDMDLDLNTGFDQLSSARMLGTQIVINDGEYTLDVTLDPTNFMVIRNRLFDRSFVQWFLLNEHDLVLEKNDIYTVSFINEHIQRIEFSSPQYLVVHDNHLEITQDTYADSEDLLDSSSGSETPVLVEHEQPQPMGSSWFRFL